MSAYSLKTHLKAFQWDIIVVVLLLCVLFLVSPVSAFSGSGSGTLGDPYQITTPSQWLEINSALSSNYKLMNDISFVSTSYSGMSTWFTGTLNGQNYTISHVAITSANMVDSSEGGKGAGLFSLVNGATVKNLHIDQCTATDSASGGTDLSIGILGGYHHGTTLFSNIYLTGSSVTATGTHGTLSIGGLIGGTRGGATTTFQCVVVNTTITHDASASSEYMGAIIGYAGVDGTNTYDFGGASYVNPGTSAGGIEANGGSGTIDHTNYYDKTLLDHAAVYSEVGLTTAQCGNTASFTDWTSGTFGIQNGYPAFTPFFAPPPAISSVNGNTAPNNATYNVNIVGMGFQGGLKVSLTKAGSCTLSGSSISLTGSTSFTGNLPLTGVDVGTYTVLVTNPDNQTSNTQNFYVTASAPTYSLISPSAADNSSTIAVIVMGAYFQNGATVELTKSGHSPISATCLTFTSSVRLDGYMPLTGAANGLWNVVITNPDAQSVTASNQFEVLTSTPPVSDFTVDHTIAHTNDYLQFSDLSTGAPMSWYWSFGDGGHSTSKNPVHPYTTAGSYTVSLAATNYWGTGTTTKSAYITVSNLSGASMTLTPSSALPDGSVMFGNGVNVRMNTTGITQLTYSGSNYLIDSWSLNITKPQEGTALHFSDDHSGIGLNTVTVYADTIQCAVAPPSDMDSLGWSAYVGYDLNAWNSTIPTHPSLQATNSLLTTWVPANVTASVASPVLGQAVAFHYHRNSYKGLLRTINGTMAYASVYPNPPVSWTPDGAAFTLTGDDISLGFGAGAIVDPIIFRQNITVFGSISTPYFYTVAIDPITAPEFKWRNAAGNVITTASNTDSVTFGLDTHNYGETYGNTYNAAIDANMYFYNTATKTWDLITTTPNPANYQESPAIGDGTSFYNHQVWLDKDVKLFGHFTPSIVGQYKIVFNTTGGIVFYTSPVLTVNANLLNPVNAANGAGSIFGIGGTNPGDASLLIGVFIMAIIAIVAFLISRFSVYGLIAGLIVGLLVSYALGLFPVWMILVVIALSIGGVAIVFLFGRSNDSGGSGGAAV